MGETITEDDRGGLTPLRPVRQMTPRAPSSNDVDLAAALVARSALGRETDRRSRAIAVAICVGYIVLGIIAAAAEPVFFGERGANLFTLVVTFGFPALIITMLTVPPRSASTMHRSWPASSGRGASL